MRKFTFFLPLLAAAALGQSALAAGDAAISTAESERYGAYLVGPEGKPLYLFTTDTKGGPDAEPKISCTSEACLEAWPLVTLQGEPTAGGQAEGSRLGAMTYEGRKVATYGGWPLYTYAPDSAGQPPRGQDVHSFGGEWYLIGPDGEKIERE